jgi:vitamin-K-epoxide reductase (warfarin-sensitive)
VQPAVSESLQQSSGTEARPANFIFFRLIATLSLVGVLVSAVSLQRHYARSATQFCDLNQRFSCDIVNRSEYSSIVGIPVAGIGVAGYAALIVLATYLRSRTETVNRLLGASLAGLAFALYLTYVEAYVLETWCILCLASLALISLISLLAVVVKLRGAKA